jgi:hypothetical protein
MKYNINLTVELKEGKSFRTLMSEIAKLKLENAVVLESNANNIDDQPVPPAPPKPKKV